MKKLAVLLAVTLSLSLAACSSSKDNGKKDGQLSGSITVFAAASLTDTFNTLGSDFETAHSGTKIAFNYGGSSALATQIDQGADGDVFASAAPTNMDDVTKAGSASHPVTFVKNTMEIAAAPGNPKHIAAVADLAGPGVKVALCEATVPCGAVAAEVFKNAGVSVTAAANEPDVKSTLAIVESGEVDAGMVYVTDVKAAGSKVVGVPIPANQNASTDYPIAALKNSKNPALAKAFVDYVLSTAGQQVLSAAGFQSP
ncbi:MAG: molybdate ABC transporter substrate-binding protein [Jatrophihabitantaceae bacterium]